jgi:hypothetical protein
MVVRDDDDDVDEVGCGEAGEAERTESNSCLGNCIGTSRAPTFCSIFALCTCRNRFSMDDGHDSDSDAPEAFTLEVGKRNALEREEAVKEFEERYTKADCLAQFVILTDAGIQYKAKAKRS